MTTKMEYQDVDSVKTQIMEMIVAYDDEGISEADLSKTMMNISPELRKDAINSLMNEGKIQLCRRGSELVFRANTSDHSALKSANASVEEKAVFRVIENAGNKGIWNREIRSAIKLPMSQMTKILKNLETKKLIKAVKSVTAQKKKLYMLYGIEPDKSVTGGAWYSGTEFESEYVQVLHEQCYQFIKRRLVPIDGTKDFVEARDSSLVSSAEVKDHIDNLKISNVKLSLQDIEVVLETILFDGLIEKITVEKKPDLVIPPVSIEKVDKPCTSESDEESEAGQFISYYRALNKVVESCGLMRVPCGQCPYVHECRPEAVISPDRCQYFDRWFSK